MDEPWGHYTQWTKPATKGQTRKDHVCMIPLTWGRGVKVIETGSGMIVATGWVQVGRWGVTVQWVHGLSFARRRKFCGWRGGGRTTMWMYLLPLNCSTSKWLRWQILCCVYFTTIRKNTDRKISLVDRYLLSSVCSRACVLDMGARPSKKKDKNPCPHRGEDRQ